MTACVILLAAACSSGGGDSTATPASPTGSVAAGPTPAASELQPPPLPTCPPQIDCGIDLRTVTIKLWSCEGGPCTGSEESGCQRGVSIEIGENGLGYNNPEPEPFFCAVQFHRVPVFTYVVRVSRRVACGPDCDVYEACAALASENHIAIVPVDEGECHVRVIG